MKRATLPIALALAASLAPRAAPAQSFANPTRFAGEDGIALYRDICQACHMPNGQGTKGAGAYPALAKNEHLSQADYPVLVVLNGRKSMPGLAPMLTDAQVAAVVNYVRTNFGNTYTDAVTPADVATARKP